jgi:hypothetical protein
MGQTGGKEDSMKNKTVLCLFLLIVPAFLVFSETYSLVGQGVSIEAAPSWNLAVRDGSVISLPVVEALTKQNRIVVLLEVRRFQRSENNKSTVLYDALFTLRKKIEDYGYVDMFNPAPRPDTIGELTYLSLGGPIQSKKGDFESMAAFSLVLTPINSIIGIGVIDDDVNEAFRLCENITATVRRSATHPHQR